MSLSPREHGSLQDIADRLAASDPWLARMLQSWPAVTHERRARRELLAWRLLAGLLFVAAYAVTEWGLIRAGLAVAADGALLGVIALLTLGWAGHRRRCAGAA